MRVARPEELLPYDIGGPCCIAGDVIARLRPLPRIYPGDFIIAHDVGGYYHSAWSYYNSRQPPALFSYKEEENIKFTPLRVPQTVNDTVAFFT